jgi:TetR/AcrR family transcriptional regulator
VPSPPLLADDPTAARRGRRKQARPAELLEAALDLFVDKGYAATRVEEIAARAGVSKGTLFLYFPSKDELFKAVVHDTISRHFSEWQQELAAFRGSSTDLLATCMQVWCERVVLTKASGITKLMFSEAQNFPEVAHFYEQEVIVPGKALLRHVLERGVATGEFDIPDLDHAVLAVIAPMIFLAMHKHSLGRVCTAGPLDAAAYLKAQLHALLHGFRARDGRAP